MALIPALTQTKV